MELDSRKLIVRIIKGPEYVDEFTMQVWPNKNLETIVKYLKNHQIAATERLAKRLYKFQKTAKDRRPSQTDTIDSSDSEYLLQLRKNPITQILNPEDSEVSDLFDMRPADLKDQIKGIASSDKNMYK